jgi:hypothetical protein
MSEAEMQQKVEQAAKSALGNAPLKSFQVRPRVKSFLDGSLFFVYYQRQQDPGELLLYAYLRSDGEVVVINNIEELGKVMSVYRPQTTFFGEVFSLGAIAGLIAIMITVTLCYLIAVQGVKDPPQILSAALTAILGFYFGSKVSGKKQED